MRERYFAGVREEQKGGAGKREAPSPSVGTSLKKRQKVDENYITDLASQLGTIFDCMIAEGADVETILTGLQARTSPSSRDGLPNVVELEAQEDEEFDAKSDDGRRSQPTGSAGTFKDRKPLRPSLPALQGMPHESENGFEPENEKDEALAAQRKLRATLRKRKKEGNGGETHEDDMNEMEKEDDKIKEELAELDKTERAKPKAR